MMPRLPFEVPIESLRPGGLPADSQYEPPHTAARQDERLRDLAGELRAQGGRHSDGAPATAAFDSGGNVFYPAAALPRQLPRCGECGLEYVSAEFLAAHRAAAHQEASG